MLEKIFPQLSGRFQNSLALPLVFSVGAIGACLVGWGFFINWHENLLYVVAIAGYSAFATLVTTLALPLTGKQILEKSKFGTAAIDEPNKSSQDITITRAAELERDRLQHFLDAVVQGLPIAVFGKEAIGLSFSLWNHTAEEMFGLTREQVIGKTDYDFFPKDQADFFVAKDRETLAGRKMIEILEEPIDSPKGSRLLHTRKVPVFDSTGQASHLLGISWDITDEKKAEQALRTAKEIAESAAKTKAQFLANMSHEIRTPMNGVIGMADLLSDTDLNEKQKEYVDLLQKCAQNLLVIINDILDISKIEAGKLIIQQEEFDLVATLKDLYSLFRPAAKNNHVDLQLAISGELINRVIGDELRLRQIISNLVSNAIKFSSGGKVTLRAEKQPEKTAEHRIRIEVEDTGIGIRPEQQHLIFSSFTQADGSTTRKFGGTGLGLTIVKQLTELMGGAVGFQSEFGKGSRFCIELPFRLATNSPAHSTTKKNQESPKLVFAALVVDDDATNRTVAGDMLKRFGAKVTFADSAQDAIAISRMYSFDMIFMDIQMPEIDGVEATRQIRKRSLNADTTIVAMTANILPEDRKRCFDVGMNDYLQKPVTLDTISETVKKWIEKNSQAKQNSAPGKTATHSI